MSSRAFEESVRRALDSLPAPIAHELGHYLGMDEGELEGLGYG